MDISVSAIREHGRVAARLGSFQAFRDFIAENQPRFVILHDLPDGGPAEGAAQRLADLALALMRRATEGLPAITCPPRVRRSRTGWTVDARLIWVRVVQGAEVP